MRGLKKILSTMLVGAMLSTGISSIAALPSDVAGTNIEEQAELLGALGIMVGDAETGNFRPDANIKRSEFAKIAVTTLGLSDIAESNKNVTKFPDVGTDHWANGYINVAVDQGIIIGDENGNFRPDDNVNYAEAMTVLVRMLGREPVAQSNGTWPTGYIVAGTQAGINKGVASHAASTPITRAVAAQLDFNALTIKMMEQTGFGNNVSYEVVDKTILEDKLGVVKTNGQLVANGDTRIGGGNGLKDDEVQVGDNIYKIGETNADKLLGYNVVIYSREDDRTGYNNLLVARADSAKNSTLEINASNIHSMVMARSGSITLKYWEDKENDRAPKTAYIETEANLVYNGKSADLSSDLLQPAFGKLVMLDTDNNEEYDVVFSTEYTNYVVEDTSLSTQTVTDKYGKPSFRLDPEDTSIKYSIEDKDGNAVKFEDIKEWNVLSVTESLDKSLIKIGVSSEYISGRVSEKSDDKVTIDGKSYEIAANYPHSININDEGTFYLDIEGKIAAVDSTTVNTGNYAYLLEGAKSGNVSDVVEFKLFNKEGETVILQAAEKVQLNKAAAADAKSVLDKLSSDGSVVQQLITYDVNADGKISKINTASDKTATQEYSKEFSKNFESNDVIYKSASSKLGRFNINENTIVFDIPAGESDSDNYAIRGKSMFVDGNKYNVSIFDMGEDLTASVVLVTNSSGKTNDEAPIAVIDKIVKVQNDRGEIVEKAYMLYKGESVSFLGDKSGVFADENGDALKSGDVIQFKTNARGEIDKVNVLFDVSTKDTEFVNEKESGLVTVHGKVVKKFANSVNVSVNDGTVENYTLNNVTVYKYDSTKNSNKVTLASSGDIIRYDEADAQTLFIRIYNDEVKEMVIIK